VSNLYLWVTFYRINKPTIKIHVPIIHSTNI